MGNFKYDYYRIFNITSKASDKLIKYSYKELLSKYHPDVSKDKDSLRKTQIINEGYNILINHKQEYDDWYNNNIVNYKIVKNNYIVIDPFKNVYISYENENNAIKECRNISYRIYSTYKELNDELKKVKKKLRNKSIYDYKFIFGIPLLICILNYILK